MLRFSAIVLATLLVWAVPAVAQRGQQVFDLLLQGAQQEISRQQQLDFERQQQREYERRQRQELNRLHQQYVAEWHTCHGGDAAACDRALSYAQINSPDRQTLLRKRAEIIAAEQEAAERARREQYEAEVAERQQRERAAAAEAQERLRLEQQVQALLAEKERQKTAVASIVPDTRPTTAMAISFLATLALLGMGFLRHLRAAGGPRARETTTVRPRARHHPAETTAPDRYVEPHAPALPMTARDTPGALAAMELALAYIQEVQEAKRPDLEDTDERKQQLNTLALAAKQLDLAQRCDADAILDGQTEDVPYRFSINELKAEALLLEGMTHQLFDERRAIPALTAATTLNPNNPRAFYILGLTQAANMNKVKAIAAFERAVALDPKNITYRKELNRAQNLTGAEVAAYHATRAAEKLVDGAATSWNVFAIAWNIVTFPLRIVFGAFRLLRLYPFA